MTTPRFDTELPPKARRELFRSYPPRQKIPVALGWIFPSFLLLGLGLLMIWIGQPIKETKTSPTPEATPTATPKLPSEIWMENAPPPPPRAELVPPRAVRAWPLGVYHWARMPDGIPVWCRHMGSVNAFSDLPLNPKAGDCWDIPASGASWVWSIPAGWTHNAWVDPTP
jgi:hypothetical protein